MRSFLLPAVRGFVVSLLIASLALACACPGGVVGFSCLPASLSASACLAPNASSSTPACDSACRCARQAPNFRQGLLAVPDVEDWEPQLALANNSVSTMADSATAHACGVSCTAPATDFSLVAQGIRLNC